MASALPEIPVSVYETFVLEERHEFNKTMPGLFVSDLPQDMGTRICHRWTVPFYVSLRVQMGRRPLCSVAHGIPVRCPCRLYLAEVLMKRIKAGVSCVHGDSVPDRDPATVQQAFAAVFGRAAFSHRGTGWETQAPAQAPV